MRCLDLPDLPSIGEMPLPLYFVGLSKGIKTMMNNLGSENITEIGPYRIVGPGGEHWSSLLVSGARSWEEKLFIKEGRARAI